MKNPIDAKNIIRRAVGQKELARAAAYMEAAIKKRVAQGTFLNPGASREYSPGHAAKRQKKGLPVGHVDLFFSGNMLDALKTDVLTGAEIALIVGYIDGKSESRAIELAGYHNLSGAGKNKIKRVFIGLTDAERQQVVQILKGS